MRLLAVECEASLQRVSCRSFFDLHVSSWCRVWYGGALLLVLLCMFFSRAEKTRDFKLKLFYITFNIKYVNIFSAKHLLI